MAFRFYHRFRLAPGFTLNLGKRGVSVSAGVRGAHVTIGTHGARETVGVPRTGISYTATQGRRSGRRSAPAILPPAAQLPASTPAVPPPAVVAVAGPSVGWFMKAFAILVLAALGGLVIGLIAGSGRG